MRGERRGEERGGERREERIEEKRREEEWRGEESPRARVGAKLQTSPLTDGLTQGAGGVAWRGVGDSRTRVSVRRQGWTWPQTACPHSSVTP